MPRRDDAPRDLLFGLLALQNGLVSRDQLVAAVGAWTGAPGRALAALLVEQGALDPAGRDLLRALADRHLHAHGGDPERSLAALDLSRSTREGLAEAGGPDVEATLAHVGSGSVEPGADRTATYAVGAATADGRRFRVLRPHARGGLGAVFVALDEELHREVALKQILDQHADDPASRQRFVREAEITGGLEHPGIVPVYGLGTYADGRPYYAMRFVRGDSLKEAIGRFHADDGPRRDPGAWSLALRKLLRRFSDVCDAIDYAHSRGVLHRDLKPGNVIVGKHGEPLVVDWGLAKPLGKGEPGHDSGERTLMPSSASGSAETLPGSALGTPAYMSPEQAAGALEKLGPRSDVYSLGATLYCLLTGKPPFAGEAGEVLRAVQRGEFAPPRQLDPSIDRALEAVCLKAMARKPEDRYRSPRALADDVERWMADEPVTAWREPLARRARRWARQNRTAVTGAAAALLAGLIGLGAVAAVQAQYNGALSKANTKLTEANAATSRALAETREEKTKTEEALAQSEAVSTFLVEAFRSPDPSQDGRTIKVADVLDRAAEKLDKGFSGSEVTKGALFNALGLTCVGLGLYDRAVERHTKARAVREAKLGPDHPDTLTSRNNLAGAYLAAGRTAEAIALFEGALKVWEAKLGPDHPDTLTSRNNLALAYAAAGRTADAIALHEATLKLRESALGSDHPDTLTSRNNLAAAYWEAGRTAEAIALHEATLKVRETKLGPDHPLTLHSRNNLAGAYRAAGRTADAIALHEATLKLSETKHGPEHPDTLTSRNNLALAYAAAGRTAAAIALHEATLRVREARLGPDPPPRWPAATTSPRPTTPWASLPRPSPFTAMAWIGPASRSPPTPPAPSRRWPASDPIF
jgi:tetratricopeptide (TPR) repeat protein/tRNA A-37 threonylcarbamoyl transferase component Bud32